MMTPQDWIVGPDTGVSSKTIWATMTGAAMDPWRSGEPHDGDDFGRCHRLLRAFPEWRERMPEVAVRFPIWMAIVREWDALTALYLEDLPAGWSDRLFQRLLSLREEGMLADGWVQDGPHCLHKPTARAEPTP